MLKDLFTYLFMILGAIFILISSIGLLRFDNLFSRMHATTKATSFGLLLLLVGVILYFSTWMVALKAFLIILFIYLTAPLAAHSIASSFRSEKKPEEE